MVHRPPIKLSSSSRFRFAPSPTGSLHIGGLRTALYNHLLARNSGGKWILRIEDTDQSRKVEGAVDSLRRSLDWAGLDYDEGPGRSNASSSSYIQSERLDLYRHHAQLLLDSGHAYRCFCSASELEAIRQELKASGSLNSYDRRGLYLTDEEVHRKLKAGEKYVIRLKSHSEPIPFTDLVCGRTDLLPQAPIDDAVLVKSDGFPTYHLASVVDDHDMGITHVLRGVEWRPSTNKHLQLYEAFGWTPPEFAHLPLLINPDGTKLSKRTGSVAVEDYIKAGYEPAALNNFIALMGWGCHAEEVADSDKESPTPGADALEHESGSDFFTMPALIDRFNISRIMTNPSQLNPSKLEFLQKLHVSYNWEHGGENERAKMIAGVKDVLQERYPNSSKAQDEELISRMIESERIRLTVLKDIADNAFIFNAPDYDSPESLSMKTKLLPQYQQIIEAGHAALSILPESDFASLPPQLTTSKLAPSSLQVPLTSTSTSSPRKNPAKPPASDPIMKTLNSLSMPDVTMARSATADGGLLEGHGKAKQVARAKMWTPLRWALTAQTQGPSVRATIGFLGKEETLQRLKRASKI